MWGKYTQPQPQGLSRNRQLCHTFGILGLEGHLREGWAQEAQKFGLLLHPCLLA